MPLTTYNIATVSGSNALETVSGTYEIILYCDVAGLTIPSSNTVLSMSEVTRRPEDSAAVFEVDQLTLAVQDDTTTYTEGFWYKVMNEATEIQLRVNRVESGSPAYFFWGATDGRYMKWREFYVGSSYVRQAEFTVCSMLKLLEDASFSDIFTEFHSHTETTVPPVPTGLAVTQAGTPGSTTYGYRVQAVYGNGASAKCTEVTTTTGATELDGTNYNAVTWNAMPGATVYWVYRSTSGGSGQSGTTGRFAASTSSTTYNDQGALAGGDPDIAVSDAKYGSLASLIASMAKVAFGNTYDETDCDAESCDIALADYDGTGYFFLGDGGGEYCILTYINAAYSEYFDSTDTDNYLGSRYSSPLALLGAICRNFGYVAGYYYDDATSKHKIHLVTRGSSGSTVTVDGNILSSLIINEYDIKPKGYEIVAFADNTQLHQRNGINDNFEFSLIVDWIAGRTATPTKDDTGKYYVVHLANVNGWHIAPEDVYWRSYTSGTNTQETTLPLMCTALARYYEDRYATLGRVIEREYDEITATLSGVSNTRNVDAYNKVSVNDGTGAATYVITEARLMPEVDRVFLQLVKSA